MSDIGAQAMSDIRYVGHKDIKKTSAHIFWHYINNKLKMKLNFI